MFPRHLRPPRANIEYARLNSKTPGKPQPVFTIHTKTNHEMFALHLEQDDATTRTCVAVFMKKDAALTYGRLLENHRKAKGDWPTCVNGTPKIDLEIGKEGLVEMKKKPGLNELYVEEWSEEEVQDLCIHTMSNMLLFYDIEVSKDKTMGMKIDMHAELAEFELADTFVRQRFEVLYTNRSVDDI